MRRVVSLFLSAALLLGAACSTNSAEVPPAGLAETYDLVHAADLVFITSAETNDLRVIEPAATDYVRAPNPLEALSIPVVKRPDKLARDVAYDAPNREPGDEVTGPYVYVRSASESLISVVSTNPAILREVALINTHGAVTAFAARGPGGGRDYSELYFATQVQGAATLYRVRLPQGLGSGADPVPVLEPELLTVTNGPAEGYGPVTALLVLPETGQLAMATRSFQGTSTDPAAPQRPFATVKLQVGDSGATVTMPLRFTTPVSEKVAERKEVPVRMLLTYGRLTQVKRDAAGKVLLDAEGKPVRELLPAPKRIFGVIDEQACVGLIRCGGVLAVESESGEIANAFVPKRAAVPDPNDSTKILRPETPEINDQKMLPLAFDTSLPTGFTLAPEASFLVNTGVTSVPVTYPLVGVVAHASGGYLLFDALNLTHLDQDVEDSSSAFANLLTATNNQRPGLANDPNFVSVRINQGYVDNSTLSVIYEGPVSPGFFRIEDVEPHFRLPAGLVHNGNAADPDVLVGDVVQFFSTANAASACTDPANPLALFESSVASVTPAPAGGEITFTLDPAKQPPADCARFFQVRSGAGTLRPFVAYADSAYLGRVGEAGTGGELVLRTPPRFLGPGFTPDVPEMTIATTASRPLGEIVRGDKYVFNINAHFDPYSFTVATDVPRLTRFFIPGPVVFSPGVLQEVAGGGFEPAGANRLYVAYPTADGVLQIFLGGVHNNGREALPVVPFQ